MIQGRQPAQRSPFAKRFSAIRNQKGAASTESAGEPDFQIRTKRRRVPETCHGEAISRSLPAGMAELLLQLLDIGHREARTIDNPNSVPPEP